MAKVRVSFDERAFSATVNSTFQRVRRSKQLQTEIGKFLSDRIRNEARRGRPLNKTRSYPSLADTTVANRARLAKLNPTGKPFRPSLSNTLLTGQLLNSIDFEAKADFVIVGPNEKKRRPYVTSGLGTRQKLKPGVNATNQDLIKTLADIGFVVFDAEVVAKETKIVQRIKNITLRFLRRALNTARLRG